MERITLTQLKKFLKGLSSAELILEIGELFKTFPDIRDYYESRLISDGNDRLLAHYKKIIEEEFFPGNDLGRARLSIPRKALAGFRKVSSSTEHIVDLMLFSIEMGIEYTTTFGDMDESYYRSLVSMYERALDLLSKKDLDTQFSLRCRKIVDSTSDFAWDFYENIQEIYHQYF